MPVIDVDSHLMEPFDWLETRFPELAEELPPVDVIGEMLRVSQDDMMDALPASIRREARRADDDVALQAPVFVLAAQLRSLNREQALDLVSDLHGVDAVIAQKVVDVLFARGASARRGTRRRARRDRHRLPVLVDERRARRRTCSSWWRASPTRALEALAASNTWSAEAIEGHTDRLSFATLVDVANLDWAIAEIARTRAREPDGADQDRPRRREVDRAPRLRPLLVGDHRPRHGRDDPHRARRGRTSTPDGTTTVATCTTPRSCTSARTTRCRRSRSRA